MSAEFNRAAQDSDSPMFAVLGAGSWGTALSMQLMRSGSRAVLWDWNREHIEAIGKARCNEQFLPDYPLPDDLVVEPDLERAVRMADEILIVVPCMPLSGFSSKSNPG